MNEMNEMKEIDIAMATYNGEPYILEQIESIQRQTYVNWNLYISDDGSTDNTVKIISNLVKNDTRIKIINRERQGGVVKNFNKALMATTAEYVVLSDQDDIWLDDRLEKLVYKIQEIEGMDNKPKMVFTDLELVDSEAKTIAMSFYKSNGLKAQENIKGHNLLWHSTVYGCTTIMNRKLLDQSLPIPDYAQMHDQWLALNAKQENGLYYFDYKSLKYRQHANNVVGGSSNGFSSKLKNFRKNVNNIKASVLKIKILLKNQPNLYQNNSQFNNYFDFLYFAIKEIFPKILLGDKKIQTLFIFIGFFVFNTRVLPK